MFHELSQFQMENLHDLNIVKEGLGFVEKSHF